MSLVGVRGLARGIERGGEQGRKRLFIYHRTSRRRRQTAAEKQSVRRRLVIDENQTPIVLQQLFTQRQTKSLAFAA